eukprot:gnl/TRDRNA2_/TRDRNA2_62100_c0_seq1.p1 gnl/TRDRNA2_/TRDRNA2_62100_c0~~gnl/TRDRNA2_/TRDRNA2_62100_c0_seq1.p1  ORF type:complete len:265 (-),score=51.18 gnl/TRDRNA2_/TRDRNA2_62100_c0_seq1:71-865(-)
MPDLIVYVFKPDSQGEIFVPDISPFVGKLLAHLVLTGTEFTVNRMVDKEERPTPPKGKHPYVKFPDGKLVGDSQMIIEELVSRTQTSLDEKLSSKQQALSHLVRRTLEESMYWNWVIEKRWRRKGNFQKVTAPRYFADMLPGFLGPCFGCITGLIRNQVVKAYDGQGDGRHSEVEATKLATEDLRAIELSMGNGPFFHGEEKSSIDAVLYAFVGGFLYQKTVYPDEGPDKEVNLQGFPKLMAHFQHMDRLLRVKLMDVTKLKSL